MALTFHYDARDSDRVYEAYANPPTNNCEDNDPVEVWRDEVNTDILYRTVGNRPAWRSATTPFPLPSVEFDGSDDNFQHWNAALSIERKLSDWIVADACTIMIAIYVQTASLNAAVQHENHAIITDFNALYFSLCVKNVSGQVKLAFTNDDGNDDTVEVNINLNTRYVVMARHDAGSIYLSVNGGIENATVSGNTSLLTSPMRVGGNVGFFDGFIGQIKVWNTANADGNQASELSTMINDWAPPPVVGFLSWGEASRPIITKTQTPVTI